MEPHAAPTPHRLRSLPAGTSGDAITLGNGHRLGFSRYGDPDGRPVLFFHGTPGSRLLGSALDTPARRHGVHLIAPERPGYGRSDYWRAATVADWCAAAIELPDALGFERFGLLGASGGGPYPLGFSYLYPDRLDAVTLVSSVGPARRSGLPGPGALVAAIALLSDRAAGLPLALVARHARRRPGALIEQIDRQVGPLAGMASVGQVIYDDLQEAFVSGPRGSGADLRRLRRWGFEPEDVPHEVRIWHGEEDRNVSVTAALALAARLPRARTMLLSGEGHVDVLPRHVDEILRDA
jgi:pimeloyl-ACP methyl ester carboxylesterase